MEPAPDAGLESLLAYAEQAAKRNAESAKPAPSFFKRFMMPLASLAALVTVGVVGFRASQEFETSPAAAIADQKVAAMEEKAVRKEAEEQAAKVVAQTEKPPAPQAQPAEAVAVPPVVAAAAPEAPPADPSYETPANRALDSKKLEPKNEPKKDAPADRWNDGKDNTAKEGRVAAADELLDQDYRNAGGKGAYDKSGTRDVWSPDQQQKSAPQSEGKRAKTAAPPPEVPVGNAEIARQQNFSDVGSRAAKLERQELAKDVAKTPPPPPPAPPVQEKSNYGYGLGTSSPGSGSSAQGVMGGASTRGDAPTGLSQASTKPSPVAPPKADPRPETKNEKADLDDSVLAAKKREEKEKVAAAKDVQAKQAAEEDRRAAERERVVAAEPAPVAATPAPSTAYAPPSSYAPAKKKSGFGIGVNKPQIDSAPSSMSGGMDLESEVAEQSDQLGVNSDAKYDARAKAKAVTQYVENARVASSRGDRTTEIRLLAQALQAGATGYEKTEALKRICDAYNALGEPERADPFCDQLVQEFPNTAAAQAVMSERRKAQRTAPAPKKPAAAERRYSDDASPAPKPAEAAPAQAY
jgi:hypothetical protein